MAIPPAASLAEIPRYGRRQMTEHNQSQAHGPSEVELHFKHVNEVETANFKMPETATLLRGIRPT